MTFTINTLVITPSYQPAFAEIINRMGWTYKKQGSKIVVNIPEEDYKMFDFICGDCI